MKKWKLFERLVAQLTSEEYDENIFTIVPNAKVTGFISGRKRQIDVLVDFRYDSDLSKRIIIDAKDRNRPVDIKEVEMFEGMMRDVNAERGVIVCTSGHTRSALLRAQQHIGIRLIPASEMDDFDINNWEHCLRPNCNKGLILWDCHPGVIVDGKVTVHWCGKCDECGAFHVYCDGCGAKKSFYGDEDWKCACEGPWFWLTSTEPESDGGLSYKTNYLILVFGNGNYNVVDRRPL
jgi:hypothetical protein